MNIEEVPGSAGSGDSKAGRLASQTRRRLVRGGLSAAPVALTFVSRPAPATPVPKGACLSASASVSLQAGAHSNGAFISGGAAGCTGQGPVYWSTNLFPSGYDRATSLFETTFPGYVAGKTLVDILTDAVANDVQSRLRRNLVAALLNIAAGFLEAPTVVTVANLQAIWAALGPTGPGTWQPSGSPSIVWDINQTNTWFGTLFLAAV